MATFVSTTLTKRTGATTTVFSPANQNGSWSYLTAAGTVAGFERYIAMTSQRSGLGRRTKVRVGIPQLNTDGNAVLYRPTGLIDLYIPDGTVANDVNDIVGYLNAISASSLTNMNDLLVNGQAVY